MYILLSVLTLLVLVILRHEPNPNISGKDSTASTGSDALSESSTDSIDMEGKLNESDSPVSPEISLGDFEMQEDDLSFTFDAGKKIIIWSRVKTTI